MLGEYSRGNPDKGTLWNIAQQYIGLPNPSDAQIAGYVREIERTNGIRPSQERNLPDDLVVSVPVSKMKQLIDSHQG